MLKAAFFNAYLVLHVKCENFHDFEINNIGREPKLSSYIAAAKIILLLLQIHLAYLFLFLLSFNYLWDWISLLTVVLFENVSF